MRFADFEGKKTCIVGVGREGQTALRVLRQSSANIALTVLEENSDGADAARELATQHGARLEVGRQDGQFFSQFDVLVMSPGVSVYRDDIKEAIEQGTTLTSLTDIWLSEHGDVRVIGVTGTKGKSSTSTLIQKMLNEAGHEAVLRGNVGRPLFDEDEPESKANIVVLELSSFQLARLQGQLQVGVVTNLSPEHLDWHGDEETYFRDKLRLKDLVQDCLIANGRDKRLLAQLDESTTTWFGDRGEFLVDESRITHLGNELLDLADLKVLGPHNLDNVAAALQVVTFCGVPLESAVESAKSFEGLGHRLEVVAAADDRVIVNDVIASTPAATMAALKTFAGCGVRLIVGGADRGLDLAEFQKALLDRREDVRVYATGPFGERLLGQISGTPLSSLEEAFEVAWQESLPGDVILLSPGAPSFDAYGNYVEKGEAFRRCVHKHVVGHDD